MISALVALADDLIVKNPHFAYCQTLEEGSWSWWLNGCFIYDTSATAFIVRFLITGGLAVFAARSMRQRSVA